MSMVPQQQVDFPEITEEAIAAYLKSHPDFFERHLGVLSGLKLQVHA